jgi:hypothetical protein
LATTNPPPKRIAFGGYSPIHIYCWHFEYIIGDYYCQTFLFTYITKGGFSVNERETVRFRLQVNNLTWTWLISMLNERGITTDNTTMSRIMAGTRTGAKVDEIIKESLSILDDYERYKKEVLAGGNDCS